MDLNRSIGYSFARVLLGIIFLAQGYGKVFTWGVDQFMKSDFFYKPYKDILPDYLIYATAYYTSYVELISGILLIIGYKTNIALYTLCSVILIVSIGHGMIEPIWDLSHVIYRSILIIFLLRYSIEGNIISLDYILNKNRKLDIK